MSEDIYVPLVCVAASQVFITTLLKSLFVLSSVLQEAAVTCFLWPVMTEKEENVDKAESEILG